MLGKLLYTRMAFEEFLTYQHASTRYYRLYHFVDASSMQCSLGPHHLGSSPSAAPDHAHESNSPGSSKESSRKSFLSYLTDILRCGTAASCTAAYDRGGGEEPLAVLQLHIVRFMNELLLRHGERFVAILFARPSTDSGNGSAMDKEFHNTHNSDSAMAAVEECEDSALVAGSAGQGRKRGKCLLENANNMDPALVNSLFTTWIACVRELDDSPPIVTRSSDLHTQVRLVLELTQVCLWVLYLVLS